jgi:TPP-dependent pyruvate/acetoin dehydrogenase alpha subunit
MSDTPETDDQPIIYAINDNGYQVPCVDLEFARRLERERDEARDMVGKLTEQGLDLMDANRMLKRERNEATQRRMETILQCELLQKERDEARDQADSYRIAYCSSNGIDKTPTPFSWEVTK